MFQKNLAAIKAKNPQLAKKLENIDINTIKSIDVYKAENDDLIIAYNNTPLHSNIDPIREAKTTWNRTIKTELKKNDLQLVYGIGLGYLFKRAYISSESKIIVFEPIIEILRFVLEYVDFSGEFSDERVYITDNISDISNKLQKEFLSGDRVEFLFLNNYALISQETLGSLTSKVFEIIKDRKNDETTIFNLSRIWTENFIKNILNFSEMRPMGYFEDKFADKTALIVSAGPSLNTNIEQIRENQDKFIIISVGKALGLLANAGIVPDFAVFADARYCMHQCKGHEDVIEKTNLILLSKSDNYCYNLKSNSKILYLSDGDSTTDLFKNPANKSPGIYKSGSSVSIISYYIAKILGFGRIIFSGLDLGFVEDMTHADQPVINYRSLKIVKYALLNYPELLNCKNPDESEVITNDDYNWIMAKYETIYKGEYVVDDDLIERVESKKNSCEFTEYAHHIKKIIGYYRYMFLNQEAIHVKDKDGNDLLTRTDYAWFIRQLGEIFTEELNLAKIINTSLKGAYIKGMAYMTLAEAIEDISAVKPDVNQIISDVYKNTQENWKITLSDVYSKAEKLNTDIKFINQESVKLHEELYKVCSDLNSSGVLNYSAQEFEDLNNKVIAIRQNIINNVFITNSIQETIWNYTKNFITKTIPTREEVISNLELDRNFYKIAAEESSIIHADLTKTLHSLEQKCLTV